MKTWNGLKPIGNWVYKPIKKKKQPPKQNPLSKEERKSIQRMVEKAFPIDILF